MTWEGSGRVGWCYVCVSFDSVFLVFDGRSMYLYIVIGGTLRILGAHSVQSYCTLSISASHRLSQIQTCLCVVLTPGFVSISPTFMRSSAINLVALPGRLAPQKVNRAPISGGGRFRHNLQSSF